jgi:heptosyltransferase I
VPVVRTLQQHWPDSKISWIIGVLEHRLLQGLEGVEFIVFDKRGGWKAFRQLHDSLHYRHFDILLHMQVSARSNLLSRLVDAPLRLGWNRLRSRDFHHWFTNQSVADVPFQHQVEGFLEFPRALGLNVGQARWDLPVTKACNGCGHNSIPRPALVISPCLPCPAQLKPSHYATVADFASQLGGLCLVAAHWKDKRVPTLSDP